MECQCGREITRERLVEAATEIGMIQAHELGKCEYGYAMNCGDESLDFCKDQDGRLCDLYSNDFCKAYERRV